MPGAELIVEPEREVMPSSAVTLFGSDDPATVVSRATEASRALMGVVKSQRLAVDIGGKDYLLVEAWTLLGSMVGVFPVTVWTHPIKDGNKTVGWEARVEARTRDGGVVGSAETMCMRDEERWSDADEHALRSMAQTRGVSKALAAPLRFIAVLAGYAGTPAEEMPRTVQSAGSSPAPGQPYRVGDACPLCTTEGLSSKFRVAKAGPYTGQLQCGGKRRDDTWCNHLAPTRAEEAIVDPTPIPFP